MSFDPLEVARARPPEGYIPLNLQGGFGATNGALFWRQEGGGVAFGMRIEERHCSPTGKCHGGWLATFCDMVMPLTSRLSIPAFEEVFMLTVNMSLDYIAPVSAGDWLEGRASILKQTKRLVFVQGLLTVDDEVVVRSSAILRPGHAAARVR